MALEAQQPPVNTPFPMERGMIDYNVDGSDSLHLFSGRVRYLRELKGFTQMDLANALGVSRSSIGQWETTNRHPSNTKIEEIARVLNSTPEWIAFRTGSPSTGRANIKGAGVRIKTVDQVVFGLSMQDRTVAESWGLPTSVVSRATNSEVGNLIIVEAPDDAVKPFFSKGDMLLVDTGDVDVSVSGTFFYWDGKSIAIAKFQTIPSITNPSIRVTRNDTGSFEMIEGDIEILGRVKNLVWG